MSAWLLGRGLLEMVKTGAVAAMVLVAILVIRFANRAERQRARSARNWSLRGTQLSVWALTAGSLANLGMWAVEAAVTG